MEKSKITVSNGYQTLKTITTIGWSEFKASLTWRNQIYLWPVYVLWILVVVRTHLAWLIFVKDWGRPDLLFSAAFFPGDAGFLAIYAVQAILFALLLLSIPYYVWRKRFGLAIQCAIHAIAMYSFLYFAVVFSLVQLYLFFSV